MRLAGSRYAVGMRPVCDHETGWNVRMLESGIGSYTYETNRCLSIRAESPAFVSNVPGLGVWDTVFVAVSAGPGGAGRASRAVDGRRWPIFLRMADVFLLSGC